ncbi:MAG: PaaI family thioesterase [Rhodospirillaceae bacterium]|nr:PaaI family thioesterase [Rhodospirillaceae bacterium]MDD9913818.1 PaaI family thioesterase [Rhodospirillaceae bacterium]MDD9928891.1 PaaI family thioesterase [Rhodospirillaceae bacterium]
MAAKRYGTVPSSEQNKMSGLAFVQGLADGSQPLNTMAEVLDYDVVEAEVGRVVITAAPTGAYLNPQGTVHGGYSATLLDACMGLAVATTLDQGLGSTTLEFKITFMRPVVPDSGTITAVGTVLRSGRRAGYAEGKITDENGKLLAHATTSCMIFVRPED